MISSNYTVISLFSGALGLDLGLRSTGRFNLLACVEKEPVFCETIRVNIENRNLPENPLVYESDIQSLGPEQILADLGLNPGDVDLVVGGPPCQSFSTAGRRGTIQDPRGTLLWDFLRFVKVIKPKTFLMENVRGLMSAAIRHRPIAERPDKGGPPLDPDEEPGSVVRLFANDLQSFSESPYHMDCFEVNAVNYGAPQLRERALFVGNRYNCQVEFPDPTHGPTRPDICQLELFNQESVPLVSWATLRDAIGDLEEDDPAIMDFSPRKKAFLSQVPPGGNWRHLPESVQRESMGKAFFAKGGRSGWWRRLSFDLPCPTLVALPSHASTSLCHPEEIRGLTVREYCRIQEFPDSWVVRGKPAQQYLQIGNAVPLRLGEIAGNVVADFLDSQKAKGWRSDPPPSRTYRRIYVQAHVRTRQWFKNGEALAWDDGTENESLRYSLPRKRRDSMVMEPESA